MSGNGLELPHRWRPAADEPDGAHRAGASGANGAGGITVAGASQGSAGGGRMRQSRPVRRFRSLMPATRRH